MYAKWWALALLAPLADAGTVFWSPLKEAFGPGSGKHHVGDIDVSDWINKALVASSSPPELLVVIHEKNKGESLAKLRNDIEAAASSTVAPFAENIESAAVPGERLSAETWKDAHALLLSRPALVSNGVCDMMVISAAVDGDAMDFSAFRSKADEATGGAVAFALALPTPLVGDAASKYVQVMTASALPTSRRLSASTYESPKKYVRMTPDLLAGILTGILLVVIVLIGLSCLNSIQTPSLFTNKNFPSSREY